MDHRFYVYVLFDWQGIPRYVGKGTGNRWLEHERKTDPINRLKNEFIERTWNMLGEVPKIKVVENLTADEAIMAEIAFIEALGRVDLDTGTLVNMTAGGEGLLNPSEEVRAKLRARPQYVRSAELRAAIAARNRARAGIPHTPEHNAKIAASLTGRPVTWGDKIGAAQRGVPETEQARQNMRKPKSKEGRANIAHAARTRKPARHPNQSIALTALWADPKFRAKMVAIRQSQPRKRKRTE